MTSIIPQSIKTNNRPQVPRKPTPIINQHPKILSTDSKSITTPIKHVSKKVNVHVNSEYTQVIKLNKSDQSIVEKNGDKMDKQHEEMIKTSVTLDQLKSNHILVYTITLIDIIFSGSCRL